MQSQAQQQQRNSEGIIDRRAFQSVIDLNDQDSTDFSTQMVNTYLAVADSTLFDMDQALCVMSTCLHQRQPALWHRVAHALFALSSPLSLSYVRIEGTRTFPTCHCWPPRCRTPLSPLVSRRYSDRVPACVMSSTHGLRRRNWEVQRP